MGDAPSPRAGAAGQASIRRSRCGKLAGELSPVQQTMVSFARALANDAQVLILDEPTASLTDTEITELFAVLRSLRDQGVAIVYVSHRLEEVFELCDRITIMRNGETVMTKDVADSHIDEVISTMVGRSPGELFPDRGTATDDGGSHRREARRPPRPGRLLRRAHRGEVLGIGGLAGSGRSELLRILAGAQKHTSGTITVGGDPVAALRRRRQGPGRRHRPRSRGAPKPGRDPQRVDPGQHRPGEHLHGEFARHGLRWAHRRHHEAGNGRPPDQGTQPPPARR